MLTGRIVGMLKLLVVDDIHLLQAELLLVWADHTRHNLWKPQELGYETEVVQQQLVEVGHNLHMQNNRK